MMLKQIVKKNLQSVVLEFILKPHFYIVKLGFRGVYVIFSYFCLKT